MKIAIDTECTGGRFYLPPPGCDYPYYISTCDEDGNMKSWGYPALRIDPLTRVLEVSLDTLEAIREYLSKYTEFVFHNAKFDLAALGTLGINPREFGTINDTIFRYHLLDNTQSLKLKDLSLLHLDIPDDDETELLDILRQARRIAKKLGWAIVNADKEETGKGHWMKMDGWIPVQIAYEHPKLRPPAPLDATHPWAHCLSRYGNRDAERTMALEILGERVMAGRPELLPRYQAQLEVIDPIQTMEKYGVSVNLDRLHSSLDYFQEKAECHRSLMQAILQVPDFNPSSSKQLQAALFEEYRLPILKLTKGGGPSTDEETLLALNKCEKVVLNPDSDQAAFLDELLSFKSANSSFTHLKTYEEARVANRLHSSFNPTGTNTTRLSSSGPNLQNIEKEEESEIDATTSAFFIRRVFGPESGRVWLDFDYDQLQLRIFAHVSGDKRMLAAFEAGWDAHNFMACQVFKTDNPTKIQRRVAKSINFGFIFGAGPDKIMAVSGDPSIWPTVQRLFPGAVSFITNTIEAVRKSGQGTVDAHGYPLRVPQDQRGKPKAYAGVVYKIQGLEGLIVKRAMVGWDRYLKLVSEKNSPDIITRGSVENPLQVESVIRALPFAFLSLQVHDQLIADFKSIPEKFLKFHAKSLRNIMQEAGEYHGVTTPASCSIVRDSWDQPEEWELA